MSFFTTTTLEVLLLINPSLSVTVNSNRYELESTLPTTFGAANVAMDVFCPSNTITGEWSSESSIPHA